MIVWCILDMWTGGSFFHALVCLCQLGAQECISFIKMKIRHITNIGKFGCEFVSEPPMNS